MNAWNNFNGGDWETGINVRDFIQKNYTPYDGDSAFLAPATARTTALREKFDALLAEEREKGGVRNIDTETVITITAFGPGYLDKDSEIIGYEFVNLGKMMEAVKKGVDANEALESAKSHYGQWDSAAKYIDPRQE